MSVIPENINDIFRFQDYIHFLKEKLDHTKESQVVGIHGDYGAGKTTSMTLLSEQYDGFNTLSYSAWRNYYDKPDSVWKSLLYELAGKIHDIFSDPSFSSSFSIKKKLGLVHLFRETRKEESKLDAFLRKEVRGIFSDTVRLEKEFNDIIEYIKYTTKEIQVNLYQEVKDLDDSLVSYRSKASQDPQKTILKTGKAAIKSIISGLSGKTEEIPTQLAEIFGLLAKEEQEIKKPRIDSLEIIQRKFDILIKFYNLFFNVPLIVLVDDMDRIFPDKSVELLEVLRIFFEKSERIHFVVAIDLRVIEKGIERKFNQLKKEDEVSRIEMEEYLEKIITLPFDLPAIPHIQLGDILGINTLAEYELGRIKSRYRQKEVSETKMKIKTDVSHIHGLFEQIHLIKQGETLPEIIRTGLQANPRKIKRFLNVFEIYAKTLLYRRYPNKTTIDLDWQDHENMELLAKMLITKLEWDEIYREFVKDKFYLCAIEDIAFLEGESTDIQIRSSKKHKFANLLGMMKIGKRFYVPKMGIQGVLENIYTVFYLLPKTGPIQYQKNENVDNIYEFTLIKYLHERNYVKVKIYVDLLGDNKRDEVIEIIQNYLNCHNQENHSKKQIIP